MIGILKKRKGIVTNSRLNRTGRFGNHIFQYIFLLHHARTHGLKFANSPWVGDELFKIQPGQRRLFWPRLHLKQLPNAPQDCPVLNYDGPLENVDVKGYFTYDTSFYADLKNEIRSQFQFDGVYQAYVAGIADWLDSLPGINAAIHVRRGDYGFGYFFLTPVSWYDAWIEDLRSHHPDATVYVATDAPADVLRELGETQVLTAADIPFKNPGPDYLPDFAVLTLASHVAISNSTFSFAATMLNKSLQVADRPSLSAMSFIPYDPWSAPPIFKDVRVDQVGPEFRRTPYVAPKSSRSNKNKVLSRFLNKMGLGAN